VRRVHEQNVSNLLEAVEQLLLLALQNEALKPRSPARRLFSASGRLFEKSSRIMLFSLPEIPGIWMSCEIVVVYEGLVSYRS
jgi:hypothetical protein